jgi:NAD(P)-dependent dehydrogenase (short-subunit alcohol dehydrogenase family)
LQSGAEAKGYVLRVGVCDVSQPDQVHALVARTVAELGRLDFIVNAAAIHPFGTAVETDPATWNECMAVNVGGAYLLAHFGIPEMRKGGGGSILNISSVQGRACQKGVAAYAATKGALHSLTRALALDHAAENIRVNSISPGSIRTPMLARSAEHFGPDIPVEAVFERFGAAHPMKRIGTPEEVADLAAFLLSDKAGFCTGGDYLIDGGLLAGIGVQ